VPPAEIPSPRWIRLGYLCGTAAAEPRPREVAPGYLPPWGSPLRPCHRLGSPALPAGKAMHNAPAAIAASLTGQLHDTDAAAAWNRMT
jgi:hypothetical protein